MADRDHTGSLAYASAAVGPVAIGAVLYVLRNHVSPANLALVLVVGVVAVAGTGRRGAAATAALMSSLSFDFFLTRPYLSLRIAGSADITTTFLLLVVGLVVGELAARGLRARSWARASIDRLQRIHRLAERISTGEEPDFIVIAVVDQLRDLLTLRDCSFSFDRPTDIGARIEPDGSVIMAGRQWPAERLGLPTRRVELPVRGGGVVLASFILTPTPARAVELEQRVVAVALADQLGAALIESALSQLTGVTDNPDQVVVQRTIAAPPERVFALLADTAHHREIDGSGALRDPRSGSQKLVLGSRWTMAMRMGIPYAMVNTVIDYEENRRIAWQTRGPTALGRWAGGRIWRYDLEPTDGGTRVTETWDISKESAVTKPMVRAAGAATAKNMTATLARIAELVEN